MGQADGPVCKCERSFGQGIPNYVLIVVSSHTGHLPPGAFVCVLVRSNTVDRRMSEEWGDFLLGLFML